jgi:hypothetical protein
MTNAPDPKTQPVRAAIDSTTMLVLARFFMPTVVAVLGYLLTVTLDDLKTQNREMWSQIRRLTDTEAAATSVQTGLSAKVDGTVKQLDHLQQQVDSLPRR